MPRHRLFYALDDDDNPVPVDFDDPRLRARWSALEQGEADPYRVARDKVDKWDISTVFLCIDHAHGCGTPVLWETMIFGPEPWDEWCERYTSYADAVAGHARAIEMVRGNRP
jgi:hypothetical protein